MPAGHGGGPTRPLARRPWRGLRCWLGRALRIAPLGVLFSLYDIHSIPIPQHNSISRFLERGAMACAAKEYKDPHRLWQDGIDPDQVSVFAPRRSRRVRHSNRP